MPPRIFVGTACIFLMLGGTLLANDPPTKNPPATGPLRSGPPVGAANDRDGFMPKWITGHCAGKRLCPV